MAKRRQDELTEVVRRLREKRVPQQQRTRQAVAGGEMAMETLAINLRTQQIAVGIPMDETLYSMWFENYIKIGIMPWDLMLTTRSTYLPDARNKVHNAFLESGLAYLFMLDSDVVPRPGIIDRLMEKQLPMVGGWYRRKSREAAWPVVYDYSHYADGKHHYNQRTEAGQGMEQVGGMGAGCWLMSRDAALAVGKDPYDLNTGGEDLVLCTRLREAGIPLWVDWTEKCAHVGVTYV